MARPLHIAIIQQSAVFLDLPASIDLAEELIDRCSKNGARLIVFGECWLTGYPAWIDHAQDYARWDDPETKDVFQLMHSSSVAIPGPEIQRLQKACKRHAVSLCMGCNEVEQPSTGTIYNSFVILGDQGQILVHHRKLMPTYTEKLLYGVGDGRGLEVAELSCGRVGALICWEHWMPLSRQVLHDAGEDIHIALWPQVHEMLQVASRHYAFEGRCYVIAAGQLMHASQLPQTFGLQAKDQMLLNGGSCVIGPDGHYILEPCFDGPEIIHCEIQDLDRRFSEKMTLDVSGHYQRPDIFDFKLRK